MTGLRRALVGIGALALVVGGAVGAIIVSSDFTDVRGLVLAFALLGSWGFVAAGLFVWWRRPDRKVGALMTLAGFSWLITSLTAAENPLIFSMAVALSNVFAAVLMHLLLSFPDGELRTRGDRLTVWAGYGLTTVLVIPLYVLADPIDDCSDCPAYVLDAAHVRLVEDVGWPVLNVIGVVVLSRVLWTVVHRWREASPPSRRVVGPVYLMGSLTLILLAFALSVQLLSLPDAVGEVAFWLATTVFVLLPYVFLGGLLRSRVLQAGAVGRLMARLTETGPGPGNLGHELAVALGDQTLTLAFWLPERGRYVDSTGQEVELPPIGSGRTVTPVERDGERVAAIIHDASLTEDSGLVEAVGSAAALALENERLDAELRARLEDLRASRARLVEAGMAERRRLERDLHDGAQQRLVSLALSLRLARNKVDTDPGGAVEVMDGAARELELALEELRELARGIHPAVLSDRGLDAALRTLAARAPLPVDLRTSVNGIPDAVESAAYFVVSEALTNVAKYAQASSAVVQVEQDHGFVMVAVSDDGIGGADPSAGTGLRGLGDRLSALDGRLEVDSAPERGTTVRARIPCA
ncbi:MAG TPA: histidine kinase [Thermoleophilaceae bacterium]|nr:histidine kinase [Thermoleophilaceae bacterium]